MEDLQRRLGARIRKMRTDLGFSQESFADACGLHRNYMGVIERGEHNMTVKTLQIVARGLKTSMSKLLAGLD